MAMAMARANSNGAQSNLTVQTGIIMGHLSWQSLSSQQWAQGGLGGLGGPGGLGTAVVKTPVERPTIDHRPLSMPELDGRNGCYPPSCPQESLKGVNSGWEEAMPFKVPTFFRKTQTHFI
ncbi:GL25488 [Drosophila persimilis]|uniref:GL25488 n=1 Tax=Drosophila persimilis TaxID=7234 RepID=B4GU85_DROPE|nr:GL25488 [Drosophila persimilis]